jgi:3-hydroxy-9,10-secoandrosta-1,3,5(10)-triene-9,17-dione monooxygenase reductase component
VRKVELSKAYRLQYPTVPAIVASSHGGKTSAMPVVSLVFLSNDPPLVGFSSSSSHSTYRTILESGCFSVSWLDAKYRRAVECLGTSSGRGVKDKLSACGLHHRARGSPSVPAIEEAVASLDCTLEEVRTHGDHDLMVGRVLAARADDDFDEYWNFRDYSPMMYTGLGRRPVGRA